MVESAITPLGSELPDRWRLSPLGEMCSKIGSGATPKGGSAVYLTNGTSFIRSQNVFDHKFSSIGLAYISNTETNHLSGAWVQEGDVLLNITGDGKTIARCCVVPASVLPARVNQHVMIIRVDSDMTPEYLQRYLSHPKIREYMLGHNSGGSRRALTKGQVEKFSIAVPPLHVQRSITAILGALDDKIMVNELIAATALDLTRCIYNSFAENSYTYSELGKLVVLKYGKTLRTPDRREGTTPVYGCTGQIGWHDTSLTLGPTPVVGRKGANAGWVSWSPKPCWVIDTAFFVETKAGFLSPEVTFLMLETAGLPGLVGDSAVPGLNREVAHKFLIKIPEPETATEVSERVHPLMARATQAEQESSTLAALRDTLLPQLMSGKLRVRDAERIVEDAV